jgi:hypothetical protein
MSTTISTTSGETRTSGKGRAVLSVLLGALSVATMPVAILSTRYFEQYELLDAAYAIPAGALLGVAAILVARSLRRLDERSVTPTGGGRLARVGRMLGIIGLCLAGTAAISVGVYGLLEFAGSRD